MMGEGLGLQLLILSPQFNLFAQLLYIQQRKKNMLDMYTLYFHAHKALRSTMFFLMEYVSDDINENCVKFVILIILDCLANCSLKRPLK